MKNENGLQRLLFAFPEGRLVINLPDDIRPGDTISGTVASEPAGADVVEKAKNQGVLEGYVIDMGDGTKIKVDRGGFMWFPKAVAMTSNYMLQMIKVLDPGAKQISAINISLNLATTPGPASFILPTLGQTGRGLYISGPFDGNASNTQCAIGGQPCTVLAESPRKVVFNTPTSVVGATNITVGDGKVPTATGAFRNVGVELTAGKTNLMKGEKTNVTVTVTGLSGLVEPVAVQVVTTGVVNMDGGNTQTLNIKPGKVGGDGNFTVTKSITATQAGGFSVTATVLVPPI